MRSIASIIAFLGLPVLVLAQGGGWRANPDLAAREAAQRPDTNYDESRVPKYTLPICWPPGAVRSRRRRNGHRTARRSSACFATPVHGRSPGPPEHVAFTVLEENPRAMDGAATLRRIRIVSRQAQRSHQFELTLFLPNRPGRAPVFLFINNRQASLTDPTRAEKSGFWPAEQLIARGYGIAAFHYGQLAPDDKDTFRDGAMALFDAPAAGKPPAFTWGAVAAWAWGASRAMDYFVTDTRVDVARVAIVGHSRGGKAALWAGAEDQRFAMVVSNESGEGGAALSRRVYGETVARINTAFPHWFTDTYKTFNGREARPYRRSAHAPGARGATGALRGERGPGSVGRSARRVFPRRIVTGVRPVGRAADRRRRHAGARHAVRRRAARLSRADSRHDLTPYNWDRFADFADRVWKK